MESKKYILGAFLAACAALVVSFAMPFMEETYNYNVEGDSAKYNEYGGREEEKKEEVTKVTFNGYSESSFTGYKESSESLDDYEEMIDEWSDKDDFYYTEEKISEMRDDLEDKRSALTKAFVLSLIGRVILYLLIAIVALSAYLYGVYDSAKEKLISFLVMRYVALVPIVLTLVLKFMEDDLIGHEYANEKLDYEFNFIPLLAATAAIAICGFMAKPKQVENR